MSDKENTTQVEVIRPPVVETKVKIIIEAHEFEMTESEAKAFADQLCDKLGIRKHVDLTKMVRDWQKYYDQDSQRTPRGPRPANPPWPGNPMFPGEIPDFYKIWCSTGESMKQEESTTC